MLHISAVTVGELQNGIEKLRGRDDARAKDLDLWVDDLIAAYNVVPADVRVFRRWSRLMAGRSPAEWRDAMIAATALVHNLVVVTRNTRDFVDFGVGLHDPFAPP